MTTAVLIMTDGRDDCLGQTVASLEAKVFGDITERWIHDDSGDPDHAVRLAGLYPRYTVLAGPARLGFGGAIGNAWRHLAQSSTAEWVLAVEDDMVLTRPVDLDAMATVLTAHPHLAQMALRRQAWNAAERAAGGVVEQHPGDYIEAYWQDHVWLQHIRFWTSNCSLFRRHLCEAGWPNVPRSEGRYTHHLLRVGLPWGVPGEQVRFGYWGRRKDEPWIRHIGDVRVGRGY